MRFPRRKALSESDKSTWAAFARLVRPLPGRSPDIDAPTNVTPSVPPLPQTEAKTQSEPTSRPRASTVSRSVEIGDHPGGLDRGTWERFRLGKLPTMRTLDLHGMTAQRAHAALRVFLLSSHAQGARVVEVITGRGSGPNGGVIRREFPLWLNEPELRSLVLAASHPHAANQGSVRLLLRRQR